MNIVKRQYATLLYTLILGVALLLLPFFMFRVKAATNPVITIADCSSTEVSNIKKAVSDANSAITSNSGKTGIAKGVKFLKFEKAEGSKTDYDLEVNMTIYDRLEQLEKQSVIGYTLSAIQNSNISKINRTKLYNFICNNDRSTSNLVRQLSDDVTADFASAYTTFKPFSGTLGWILGILSLAIFALLGITIVVDIGYIVIPIFQNFLDSGDANTKPKYVSLEAWNSVKEAEKGETFKEPLGIYFKLKTKQFLALGICLLYLVSGQIYALIADAMDVFSGLLG